MELRIVFSNLFSYSGNPTSPVWIKKCNCKDNMLLLDFLSEMEKSIEYIAYNYSTERVNEIVNIIFEEFSQVKNQITEPADKQKIVLIEIYWGALAVGFFNNVGEFHYCYGVFFKSLYGFVPENGDEIDINIDSIFQFKSNDYQNSNGAYIINAWLTELFYYSRSFSGLNAWCEFYLPHILGNLSKVIMEPSPPFFVPHIYAWCELNNKVLKTSFLLNYIRHWYYTTDWDGQMDNIKSAFGLQLVLSKDVLLAERKVLFEELNTRTKLNELNKMQIAISLLDNSVECEENLPEILTLIDSYVASLNMQCNNFIDIIYSKSRIFKILYNIINLSSLSGGNNVIQKVITRFYEGNIADCNSIVFIIPNAPQGLIYSLNDKTIVHKYEENLLIELTNQRNKLFNSFAVLKGGHNQEFNFLDKVIGLPSPIFARDFELSLYKLYDFSLIEITSDNDSIAQFDYNYLPLQAIMLKQSGSLLPINLSLVNKTREKKVENILIWKGNSFTSEIEVETLTKIFSSASINLHILSEGISSKEEFLEQIQDEKYDIIWISSHGEYSHYEPNKSQIVLSDNEVIGIREYGKLISNLEKRRLVFLNICEGGNHTQIGEFKNMGFPSLIVNASQDVLAHLWMVDPKVALAYGTLLAIGIGIKKLTFFDSYAFAMATLIEGKDKVISEITIDGCQEVLERIENDGNVQWDNILSWGSSVYYI